MSDLVIGLEEQELTIAPGRDLSFGRDADLVVDDNPYLHRRLGLFRFQAGTWWLTNLGSAIVLELSDVASPSKMTVTPGAAAPIPFERCVVRFQAGSSSYELTVHAPSLMEVEGVEELREGESTMTASQVPLNDEQRLLLVALAELRLKNRAAPRSEIPTNRQVADALGWSTTKFNRKLDNLCVKFDRLGVAGLKGDLGGLASNRRERLVDHVLTVGLIDEGDLRLLEELP